LDNSKLFPTTEGTPQGGIISPTIANLTLNGIEKFLKERFRPSVKYAKDRKEKYIVPVLT
jgi:retron-type reverse transcriptase